MIVIIDIEFAIEIKRIDLTLRYVTLRIVSSHFVSPRFPRFPFANHIDDHIKSQTNTTEGTSKHARAFNCVQRSHQQILETLPGYFVTVLFSGLEFPVTAFFLASLWLYSRKVWVNGYATCMGDVSQRYSLPFSTVFWNCKLALLMTSWFVAIQLLLGRKIFWDMFLPGGLF